MTIRSMIFALLLCGSFVLAHDADALILTIDAPLLDISDAGVQLDILPLPNAAALAGAVTDAGVALDLGAHDVFAFRIHVDSGVLMEVGVGVPPASIPSPIGMGHVGANSTLR